MDDRNTRANELSSYVVYVRITHSRHWQWQGSHDTPEAASEQAAKLFGKYPDVRMKYVIDGMRDNI